MAARGQRKAVSTARPQGPAAHEAEPELAARAAPTGSPAPPALPGALGSWGPAGGRRGRERLGVAGGPGRERQLGARVGRRPGEPQGGSTWAPRVPGAVRGAGPDAPRGLRGVREADCGGDARGDRCGGS